MQQQAVDEAGNVWNVDAQGNPIGLARAAAAPRSSNIVTLPADPTEAAKNQLAIESANLLNAQRRRDLANGDRPAPPAGYRWTANGGQEPIPGGPADPNNPRSRSGKAMRQGDADKLDAQVQSYAALKNALGGFQDAYGGNAWFGELENWAQGKFGSGTPGQRDWWAAFRTADNSIRNQLFGASLTEGEKAAYEATTIDPSMKPDQIRKNLARRVEIAQKGLSRRVARIKAGGFSPEEVDAALGEYAPDLTIATGATRTERDDATSALMDMLIRRGASAEEINAALPPGATPVDPAQVAAAQLYMKENPGYKGSFGEATRQVPNSALNRVAASGPAAGFVGGLNGLTAGFLDEGIGGVQSALTGRPLNEAIAAADAAKQAQASASPMWSLGGNIVGGLGGMALGGAGVGAIGLAPRLGRFAPLAGDLAFGTATGAGEANNNRLGGAALGAVGAAGGRVATSGVGRLFGRSVRGVNNPDVRYLADQGVPLTGGQALGGSFKAIEDKLTSVPGVGDMIQARRGEGMDAANLAAFRIGGQPIGFQPTRIGPEGIQDLHGAVQRHYRQTLDPVSLTPDTPFNADLAAAQVAGTRLPGEMAANAEYTLNRIPDAIQGGQLTGRNFQQARRGVQQDAAAFNRQNTPYANDFGDVADQGVNAMENLLERQAPGVLPEYLNANAANRRMMILADAVDKAKLSGTDRTFTTGQLGMADRSNTNRFLGKLASAEGQSPFDRFVDASQNVLPSRVPDSGTPGRAAMMALPALAAGGLGGVAGGGAGLAVGAPGEGAATGTGLSVAGMIAAGAMNTPAGRAAVARALLDRPDWARRAGTAIETTGARRAGLFGRALGGSAAPLLLE